MRFECSLEEYKKYKLGELVENVVAGATPKTSVDDYWNGGDIPWLSSGEVHKKFIYFTDKFITSEGYNNSSTKIVPTNSVLIALAGQGKTRGTVAINKIELCTNQSIASIIPNEMLNYKYLFYYLESKYEYLRALSSSDGGRGGLNLKLIRSIPIQVPSIKEQENISNFINEIDKKILLLEQKHKLYDDFKKYLMQQIFTQKLRFDFKDTWDKVLLKDVAFIPKKTKLTNVEGLKLLTVKLHTKGIEINDRIKPKLTKRGRPYYIRRSGELLIGRQNFHNGGMGIVPKSLDGGICSNAISSFNVFEDKIDVNYLYYFLARPEYYIKSERLIGGTGQKEFSEKELLKLKIDLPSLEEQNKIVDFLLNIDHKIELSENQLNKTQEFKKGLLQQMFVVRINWQCNFKLAKSPSFNKHLLILKNKIIFIIIK